MFLKYYIPGSLKLFWNFHGKTPPALPKTVDLCLEMSCDFNYNFCFVAEEIFELGNTTKSRCLGVCVEEHALGKETWINKRSTSDHRCSDWQRTLSHY